MPSFSMRPMTLKAIRVKAATFRNLFHYKKTDWVDVVGILERLRDMGVGVEILPQNVMGDKHGQTFPMGNLIQIREDIYDSACDGHPRDRLTIAHEIGHLLLHRTNDISLARVPDGTRLPAYCDSEWQANAFAGELLAPHESVKDLPIEWICTRYGVSRAAAEIQQRR